LFNATIADNIRYGANFREVTDDKFEMVAKCANAHDFITDLPQVKRIALYCVLHSYFRAMIQKLNPKTVTYQDDRNNVWPLLELL